MTDTEISAHSQCFQSNHFLSLQRLRCDGKFCDVTIKCKDTEFKAHKTVLASATEYFEAMFSNETKESRTGIIDFSHVPLNVVKQSLDFIYSGKVSISKNTAKELLDFSEMTQLDELSRLSVEFLAESINMENCSEMIVLSNLHCKKSLSDKIGIFLAKHFKEFIETDAFKLLDIECVFHCLNLMQVTVSGRMCEMQKWNGILSWINYAPEERKDQLLTLFKTIDLSFLTLDFVKDNILSETLVGESNECKALIAMGSIFNRLSPQKETVTDFQGFLYYEHDSQMIVRYELKSGSWLSPIAFPGELSSSMGVISHQGCIYVGDGARLHCFSDGKWNVTELGTPTSENPHNPCYCKCVGIKQSVFMVTHQYVYQFSTEDLTFKSYKLPVPLENDFIITPAGDRIYIMKSGSNGFVFDLSTMICSRIRHSFNRTYGFALWYDHRIYFSQSKSDYSYEYTNVYVYDPKMDMWNRISEIKTDGVAKNCYITDKLYLIGDSPDDIRGEVDLEYLRSMKIKMYGKVCTRITN